MNTPPRLGDVVALPAWLPDRPFRVLATRDPGIDGQLWLHGYLIESPRVETSYLVPLARLRRLPDPITGDTR